MHDIIYFINSVDTCIANNITNVHTKVYDQPTVWRSSAEWHRYPATVWRSSADWRLMIGRLSVDILMNKSSTSRPIVGRSLGDHRPKLHRWQTPWKSGDRSTNLLTWVLRQKSRRPTKKSAKIGADVGRQSADVARFSNFWLTDRRATVGLGNVTVG